MSQKGILFFLVPFLFSQKVSAEALVCKADANIQSVFIAVHNRAEEISKELKLLEKQIKNTIDQCELCNDHSVAIDVIGTTMTVSGLIAFAKTVPPEALLDPRYMSARATRLVENGRSILSSAGNTLNRLGPYDPAKVYRIAKYTAAGAMAIGGSYLTTVQSTGKNEKAIDNAAKISNDELENLRQEIKDKVAMLSPYENLDTSHLISKVGKYAIEIRQLYRFMDADAELRLIDKKPGTVEYVKVANRNYAYKVRALSLEKARLAELTEILKETCSAKEKIKSFGNSSIETDLFNTGSQGTP